MTEIPTLMAAKSPNAVQNKASDSEHQQIVTISGTHLLWGVVALVLFGALGFVGWQSTIAINLLNNFKSNQFADLKEDVTGLRHDVDNIKADARAERQAREIAQQLKEKPK